MTEHLSKQVTDESFKLKNIKGGSGFKAAKIFDNTAKADGKTMMITSGTIAINYILKGADVLDMIIKLETNVYSFY